MLRYSTKFSVGLTGGIGSGKTTVSNYFASLGVAVVDADEVSRNLTAPGQAAVGLLKRAFGKAIMHDETSIDRSKLRELVFKIPEERQKLEQILHPLIHTGMCEAAQNAAGSYILFSIPLLVETGQMAAFDRIAVVDAPDEMRIAWIKTRSGLDENIIRGIIQSQSSRHKRLQIADDVIQNNDSLEHLYRQIDRLHKCYLALAGQVI